MKKSHVLFSLAIGLGAVFFLLFALGGNGKAYDPANPPERPTPIVYEEPDTIDNFSYYLDPRLPQEVQDVVLANRRRLFVNATSKFEAEPGKYINLDYDESVDKGVVETLKNPDTSTETGNRLDLDIVEKELDFIMDYLKYAYGAYEYYGGDEVFYPMKDAILSSLKAKNNTSVSYADYQDVLYAYLSAAVVDCHFIIGDKAFRDNQKHSAFLFSEKYMFNKVEDRYYTDIGGTAYELISIDGEAPALLPFLDKNGHMAWAIGRPSTSASSQICSIVLLDEIGSRVLEKNIRLSVWFDEVKYVNVLYYEYERNGVKIVQSTRCQLLGEQRDMFQVMNEAGENLRGQDVVVVDVRNNYGGSGGYPKTWLEGYLGHEIMTNRSFFTSRHTETTYYTSSLDERYDNILGTYEEFMTWQDYPHWTGPYSAPSEPNANKDTLFIVLANANTSSAGEDFVDYLRQTENTIVVGTNTSGTYMTGNVTDIKLPYSQMFFQVGYNLHLEQDLSSIEGMGLQPDIWAPSRECLQRVLKFIENYGFGDAA